MRSRLVGWCRCHPRLGAWLAFSAGMMGVLFWAVRGQAFALGQVSGMAACCVALAGVCVWIIYWEEADQGERHHG
jgi:hypothetical protein